MNMKQNQINILINLLSSKGIQFEHGLSDDEVLQIEQKFDIQFPPDLKTFLQTKLPTDESFVNWRLGLHSDDENQSIQKRFDRVFDGICFDIEYNNFWQKQWVDKPNDLKECFEIAKQHYQTYPKMIPICYHRYIASSPNETDNPIFSIWQTDIIYYGYNLADYLKNEFELDLHNNFYLPSEPKRIAFWSDLIDELDAEFEQNGPKAFALDGRLLNDVNN